MTHASTSPVTREMLASVWCQGRRREVIARLDGPCLKLRLKKKKQWHTLSVEQLYHQAVRATVVAQKAERKKLREEKRKEMGR